jgi:hypothetical protein
MTDLPTIYADFQNADADGFVRLNTDGTRCDLKRAGLALADGLQLHLSDGELRADALVLKPGAEGVWRARIDWAGLFKQ